MNDKFKKLASNTLVFAIGSFGSKLITFLLVPIYTNALTQSEYGIIEIIVTSVNLVIPFLSLSIQDAVLRFGLAPNFDEKKVIKNATIIVTIGSVISLLLIPLYNVFHQISSWKYYFAILIILNMYRTIFSLQAKALGKNLIFTTDVMIFSFFSCILSIFYLLFLKTGINGYFDALIISNIISIVYLFIKCDIKKSLFNSTYDNKLMKLMVSFSVPLIFNAVSWWVANSSDRIMLGVLVNASSVGLYSVAAKIPSIITSITSIFNQAWMISSVTEFDSSNDPKFYSETFKGYNFLLILITSIFILIIRPFMNIYVGVDFRDSWQFVPLLLIGAIFYSYANFFGAIYMSAKRNVSIMLTTLIAAIANIALNYFLIPKLGIQGAVIATAVSYMLVGMYRLIGVRKINNIRINIIEILVNLIILIFQSIFIISNNYFGACGCFLGVVIINREMINIFISKIKFKLKRK